MNCKILVILLSSLTFSTAQANIDEQKPMKLDSVPIFDLALAETEDALFGVSRYPNGCYRHWDSYKKVIGQKLILSAIAQYPEGAICTRQVLYNESRFPIDDLKPGTYEIIDGADGGRIGELIIKGQREAELVNFTGG